MTLPPVRALPLNGLIVADFSRVLAGPLAAATLADLGAQVIKVERPNAGDDTRQWGPPWTKAGGSAYFECANRNKLSVELDLSDASDLRLARTLADRSDIIIENFRTGTMTRRGLGYDQIAESNPSVVYASITGFGSGQGADLPGYDVLVQAVGGLMGITGHPDEPMKVGVALVDVLTSKDAVIAVLAALEARSITGRGQHVEVNLLSSLLGSLANQASAYLATDRSPVAMGNKHPSIAPYETLATKDVPIVVCCGNDRQFVRLVECLQAPHLAQDPNYRTNESRVLWRDTLIGQLEHALQADTADAWVQRLTAAGVPAGRVGRISDAFDLAERLGLQPKVSVGQDRPPQVRSPLTFSDTPIIDYAPPPTLGQHNNDVRRWLAEETT